MVASKQMQQSNPANGTEVRTHDALKPSGLSWAPQIPTHWTVRRIKDIADLRSGDQITSEDISPVGKYPVFGGNGLRGYTDSYTHTGEYVLIGRQGALCGNINYADGSFWASEHAVVATLRPNIDMLWFGELLRVMNLNQYSNAAAQPGLSVDRIKRLPLPLPTPEEQKRISRFLERTFSKIDAAIHAKRGQLQTLDSVRKAVISRAVTYGIAAQPKLRQVDYDWLKEVPTHWDVCRVKRVLARMDYGISVSTIEEGRYPVLKMGHLQDGEISFSNLDFVDEVDENLLLKTGDLLYNRTNSPDQVGKAAVFRKSLADAITFASYLVRLRVNHRANPFFLNYVFNSDGFLGFARRLAIQSVQQSNLNSTRYSQLFIPLPPVKEQDTICAYLDEKIAKITRIVDGIESQIKSLTAYRQSLIHECVTGQRRIKDADLNRVKEHD